MHGYDFRPADYDDIPEVVAIYRSLVGTPGCTWDFDYPSRKQRDQISPIHGYMC